MLLDYSARHTLFLNVFNSIISIPQKILPKKSPNLLAFNLSQTSAMYRVNVAPEIPHEKVNIQKLDKKDRKLARNRIKNVKK